MNKVAVMILAATLALFLVPGHAAQAQAPPDFRHGFKGLAAQSPGLGGPPSQARQFARHGPAVAGACMFVGYVSSPIWRELDGCR